MDHCVDSRFTAITAVGLILVLTAGLTTPAAAAYVDTVLADSPIGFWRFEDDAAANGAIALNSGSSGSDDDGVYQGDVISAAGLPDLGMAAGFNGTTAHVDLAFGLRDRLDGAEAVSVEAWFRNDTLPTGGSIQFVFGNFVNNSETGVRIALKADPGLNVGGRAESGDPWNNAGITYADTGNWHHVVGVMDYAGDRIDIYLDGVRTSTPISFVATAYTAGDTDSQRDAIGAFNSSPVGPTWNYFFDGLIDEVAVYDYALTPERVQAHFDAVDVLEPERLWKSQVAFRNASTGVYLGSPSVARIDENALVASHDYFGPNAPKNSAGWLNQSAVYRSTDNGETWTRAAEIVDSFWPTIFTHDGATYLIGESARYGSIVIRKSTDGGITWTEPADGTTGLLRPGGSGFTAPNYFSGNNNVFIADGKIYRSFCDRTTLQWADGFETFLLWADLDDDLLRADSWHMTNKVAFPEGLIETAGGVVPGWEEGSVVQAPNGEIWNIMRVDVGDSEDRDTAAILKLSPDGTTLSFDTASGLIDMPGGSAGNFMIRRDPKTGMYLSLVNNIVDPQISRQRNYLSLVKSADLIHWELLGTLLSDDQGLSVEDSAALTGFQYAHWHFDGDDLIYIVRTAYGGAHNYHDSNRITYHVLEDYAALLGHGDPLEGDLNGDGSVNSTDLDIVRANWGQAVPPGDLSRGDADGDGSVTSDDLDIVRANWGATVNSIAVPEPAIGTLAAVGLVCLSILTRARPADRFK